MGNTDHSTPEIAVWAAIRGFHACCDCGWDDKPRWFRFIAVDRAWAHHVDTGHRIATPLVIEPINLRFSVADQMRRLFTSWPAAVALLLIPALVHLLFAPTAWAIARVDTITTSVVWAGAPDCIQVWEPDPADRRTLRYVAVCEATKTAKASYIPRAGDWVGVDPEMTGADILACTLAVNGQVVFSDGASRGDGNEVTCLKQWV